MRFRFTKSKLMTFCVPTTSYFLKGQIFWDQLWFLSGLSHNLMKQGYFVKPLCWPKRKLTIFKSTHISQLWSRYFILSTTSEIVLYSSFIMVECAIGIEPYLFPLCSRTNTFPAPLSTIYKKTPIIGWYRRKPILKLWRYYRKLNLFQLKNMATNSFSNYDKT